MPPTISQGRKIIKEIIHFYPEMQGKIQEFSEEYFYMIEDEHKSMYDIESQMQFSFANTPSFKNMSKYINKMTRANSSNTPRKKDSF